MSRFSPELVSAASAGDHNAIVALLAAAQPDIRRYARRTCSRSSDVEDAVQETLFLLSRRIGALRSARSFSSWLFAIVRRECLRLGAAMLPKPIDLQDADLDARWRQVPDEELRLDLANGIQSLPPQYRDVVLLRDIEELTVDEIAHALGLTRESAKARLHRGRLLLREYLR